MLLWKTENLNLSPLRGKPPAAKPRLGTFDFWYRRKRGEDILTRPPIVAGGGGIEGVGSVWRQGKPRASPFSDTQTGRNT